jgi:hypothetical protein
MPAFSTFEIRRVLLAGQFQFRDLDSKQSKENQYERVRFCSGFESAWSSLCCLSGSAAWGQERQERTDRRTSFTHLNGNSRQIVHLATNCIVNTAPDNGGFQSFNYDIGGNPFTVPKGFSFVIYGQPHFSRVVEAVKS